MEFLKSSFRKYKRCYSLSLFTVLSIIIGVLFVNVSCDSDDNDLSPGKFTLTVEAHPSDAGSVNGSGEYKPGEEVLIKAYPDSDYRFVNWVDNNINLISVEAEFNYVMPAENVTLTANFLPLNDYEIHFIDVGQADAILIITDEKVVLVDAGWNDGIVAGYLSDMDIDRIDIAIATHPHADHIGGFLQIFNEFEIGEVIDPGVTHTTHTFTQYMVAIDVNDIPFTEGRKGMIRDIGEDAYLEILHPPDPVPNYSNSFLNNVSVVAKVNLGQVSVLLTGDLEKEGEAHVLSDSDKLASTILKVGHHGSNTSSTWNFLQAVQPEVSVIMCGKDNQFNHPHQPVLDRLNNIGTEIYRTDRDGTIIITTDRIGYEIFTEHKTYSSEEVAAGID